MDKGALCKSRRDRYHYLVLIITFWYSFIGIVNACDDLLETPTPKHSLSTVSISDESSLIATPSDLQRSVQMYVDNNVT